MNSFVENVNYVANLDNKYGSSIKIYKNNLSLRTESHDLDFTLKYYNFDNKKIHNLEYSYSNILIEDFNATLLNLKSQIDLTGLFDCDVSFNYTNFVINNIANISIFISSKTDNIKTYELNLNIRKDLNEIYNINGIVNDSMKILPYLASIDSEIFNDIITVSENIEDIQNAEENANTAIAQAVIATEKASEAFASATSASSNASIATDKANIAIIKSAEATVSASNALASENAAKISEDNTKISENEALISATSASASEANALNSKNSAIASANTATTKANEASNSATSASASAASALASKVSAENSATTATTKASEALSSSDVAINKAGIATTKATEANSSANSALIYKNESAANSSSSLASANSASVSEANALSYKDSALSSKNSAAASEANALSYSNLANTSELNSQSSAANAATSAINAYNSEIASANNASVSSTKAIEASSSANSALLSEDKAEKWASELEDIPVEPGKYSAMHWALKAQGFAEVDSANISYDNVNSGIAATNVQDAIDELDESIDWLTANTYTKTEVIGSLPNIGLDLAAGVVATTGQIAWNPDEGTADLGLYNGSTLQIGQENVRTVRNSTASTITNGILCMFDGTIGNSGRIKVKPFTAGFDEAMYLYGVATQNIISQSDGIITIEGKVRGINTSGSSVGEVWNDEDILYAKPNDNGRMTNIVPADNELKLVVATVIKAHATNGTLEIRFTPMNENLYYTKVQNDILLSNKVPLNSDFILDLGEI